MLSANAALVRSALAALIAVWMVACGPEHGFSGAWKQNCDDPAGGCTCDEALGPCGDGHFVYALHIGRYGDDLTGVVVRYSADQPFDPPAECGCYIMQGGSADKRGLEFTLKLWPGGTLSGPGCPEPLFSFDTAACVDALRHPPCRELKFELTGDDDALSGGLTCDGVRRAARFVPSSGKTRRSCLSPEHCTDLPLPDGGPP